MKYCETCAIFRPSHAAHCNDCNNCVAGFDHHCVWMGTCVGRRNYPHFLWLVISCIMSAIFVFLSCGGMLLKLYLTWLVKETVTNVVEDGVDAATEVDGVVSSDVTYANDETVV